MGLSKKTAQAVIDAVTKDTESRRRIDSVLSYLPDGLGIAGSIRNIGIMLKDWNADDVESANHVCTGIADATEAAIKKAKIPEISEVGTADRVYRSVYHTATLIKTNDGGEYVFDWHATLNSLNPLIFRKNDWMEDKNGVQFAGFTGF